MNYYYEPVNINQWDLFEKVKKVGHVEPMLAVKGMKPGDVVLLHVGQQNKKRTSGIYAIGKILGEPYILRDSPQDYCNNKNTIDVEIVRIDFDEPLITHEDTKEFIAQFRTVHKIQEGKRTCVENALKESRTAISDMGKGVGCDVMEWIITAKVIGKDGYDVFRAFDECPYIDWHKSKVLSNIKEGDIVYIYIGRPFSSIMLKTECIKSTVNFKDQIKDDCYCTNPYLWSEKKDAFRLKCIKKIDDNRLSLSELNQKGYIKRRIQGSYKSDNYPELFEYIDKCFSNSVNNDEKSASTNGRTIICSVAEMDKYDGDEANIFSDGYYPAEHGVDHELMNSYDYDGKCRGYVEIPNLSEKLNLKRLNNGQECGDSLENVTVIWTVRDRVIGYYLNATAYAIRKTGITIQEPKGNVTLQYSFEAEKQNCFCLPPRERSFDLGGDGGFKTNRSPIRYCDELTNNQEVKLKEVLKYISDIQNGKRWLIEDDSADRNPGYELYESDESNNREYKDRPIDAFPVTEISYKHYVRDPKNAAIARKASGYKCEIDEMHKTFISRNFEVPYVEMHHLIPLSAQGQFEKSLDVPANIVALCSNCHNELHYGKDAKKLVGILYQQRTDRLEKVGLGISMEKLLSYY